MIQMELKRREELIDYAQKKGRKRGLQKGLEGVFLDVYINGFAEGYSQSHQEIISRGIKKGYSDEIIADITRTTIEEVQKIRQQFNNK